MDDDGGGAFVGAAVPAVSEPPTPCHVLINNMEVLRDKMHQLQPLIGLAISPEGPGPLAAASGVSAVIQDIVSAASSMNYALQHLRHGLSASSSSHAATVGHYADDHQGAAIMTDHVMQQWQPASAPAPTRRRLPRQPYPQHVDGGRRGRGSVAAGGQQHDDHRAGRRGAAGHVQALLPGVRQGVQARRQPADAHARARRRVQDQRRVGQPGQGGERHDDDGRSISRPYYSCPEEGCRWNRKHAKFQPLKSVICAKNHYKRSHCPKMYVCNNCNIKHFSVLSDLRTHEKHCGVQRWLCSCGTSFSRKDKLVGHLALFAADGHQPAVPLDGNASNGKRSVSR
ncbi:hypothetical protein EJB05_17937, partial [Eragrostis curvula]